MLALGSYKSTINNISQYRSSKQYYREVLIWLWKIPSKKKNQSERLDLPEGQFDIKQFILFIEISFFQTLDSPVYLTQLLIP